MLMFLFRLFNPRGRPDIHHHPSTRKEKLRRMVGKKFRTATPLKPSGYIYDDEERRVDAVCEGGFAKRDQWVKVIGIVNNFSLKVRPVKKDYRRR